MDKHIPQGYKDSPLGIIPKEWEVKRLGDLGSFKNGLNFSPNDSGISYYFLGVGDFLNRNVIDVRNLGHIHLKDKLDESYLIKDQDLVFVRSNGSKSLVGRSVLIKSNQEEATYSGFCIRFRSDNKCTTTKYIQHLINVGYLKRFLVYEGRGTNITNLNQDILGRLSFPIPPIAEQDRVLHILSIWDTAIEKQSDLNEKLKLRKRALMQQLLTGKKRLSGFSGEWKRIKLGDIAERVTRKNEEDNKNVVTISAQKGFVVQTDFFNKSVASEVLDNYFLVHKDEFCYNKSYSNGYPMGAIKRLKSFDKAVVTTLYICFKLKNIASVNIDFFEQYCESGIFNKELVKVANEGGRAHGLLNVTPADFFNMHMRIPNIDEQNAIATVLVNADKEIEFANEKLSNLQSQKRGLMQQLLTGKKRTINIE